MSETYFRTVLVVEVLTSTQAHDGDLHTLSQDVLDGDASGMLLTRVVEQCSAEEISRLLIAQGSDPEFLVQPREEDEGEPTGVCQLCGFDVTFDGHSWRDEDGRQSCGSGDTHTADFDEEPDEEEDENDEQPLQMDEPYDTANAATKAKLDELAGLHPYFQPGPNPVLRQWEQSNYFAPFTCGTCGRSWDYDTPASRCPWEHKHR